MRDLTNENEPATYSILYPIAEGQSYDHWLGEAKKDALEYDGFPTWEAAVAFCDKHNIPRDYITLTNDILNAT